MEITLEEAEQLILEKRQKEAERHIKTFEEEPELEILNGRYGPYITYKGSNYKIPKDIVPQDLSLASCLELIKLQDEKGPATTKKDDSQKEIKTRKRANYIIKCIYLLFIFNTQTYEANNFKVFNDRVTCHIFHQLHG